MNWKHTLANCANSTHGAIRNVSAQAECPALTGTQVSCFTW